MTVSDRFARRIWFVTIVVFVMGALAQWPAAQTFSAQIQNFWNQLRNGQLAFNSIRIGTGSVTSPGTMVITGPSPTVGGVIEARTSDQLSIVRMFSDNVNGTFGTSTNNPLVFQVFNSEAARFITTGISLQGGGGVLTFPNTTPTVSSGFGTSPAIAGRATSFQINVGTGGTATGGVIAMGASANQGWNCNVFNITALVANRADQRTVQTTGGPTTIALQNQTISTGAALAWTASDIVRVGPCAGY